jgi:hypothetical protein
MLLLSLSRNKLRHLANRFPARRSKEPEYRWGRSRQSLGNTERI